MSNLMLRFLAHSLAVVEALRPGSAVRTVAGCCARSRILGRSALYAARTWGILRVMLSPEPHEITRLLVAWRGGDDEALSALLPLVYRRLKKISSHLIRGERPGHMLEATALVHEAYVRLIDLDGIGWRDRVHFYAMCARIMRRVLVDDARHRNRIKRGGNAVRVETTELRRLPSERAPQIVALDEALAELAEHNEEMARIVELRFFGGLDREEIGEVMDMSSATVTRRWRAARAWLISQLGHDVA
ncbi:MAG: sigma-70 family RNA polymerase sigma factor [Acidobacteriota bacterium]